MNKERVLRTALLCGVIGLAAPAAAQTVTPPVVTDSAPVAPPLVTPTRNDPAPAAPAATSTGADAVPVNPEAAAQAAAEDAERKAARRVARPAPAARPVAARAAPRDVAPAPAPAPAAPVAQTPAPVAAQPAPAPVAAAPAASEQPAAPATQTTTRTETQRSGSILPWAILAVVVLAGIVGALIWRRRRAERDAYQHYEYVEPVAEPAYAEPAPAAAPAVAAAAVAVAPAVPEDATLHAAEAEDVAALTAGATHVGRPWLELAMRPVRAGTTDDEALVEIELTVGNAGEIAAEDVRISTFMLPAGADSEMDRLLTRSRVDAAVAPLTIAPGDGTRVDATLALPREELMSAAAGTFQPVVVADARYRLPDGSEGRTSASFLIGGSGADGSFEQLLLDRPVLREDVEARLYREPARV